MAKEVGAEIQRRLGFPYVARDWMQLHRNLFAALKLEKLAMFIILTMIVLVAAFNIVRLQSDVYLLDAVPILMKGTDLALIASSTLVLSFLATLYPSWRAARLDPVVARSEEHT